jgi:hypothetical protein
MHAPIDQEAVWSEKSESGFPAAPCLWERPGMAVWLRAVVLTSPHKTDILQGQSKWG